MPPFNTKYTVNEDLTSTIGGSLKRATQLIDNTRPMMYEISLFLHGRAIKKLQKGKRSGVLYKRGSKFHRASASGENPKTDTGFLAGSLRFKASKRFGIVSTSVRYASILEDQLNRPWLEQTLDESGPSINRIIARHIGRAL